MAIKWSPQLAVNIPEIDEQHRQLFEQINDLYTAIIKGEGLVKAVETIEFLEEYVDYHFATEERFMQEADYPELPSHRAEHIGFAKDIQALKAELKSNGVSTEMAVRIQRNIRDWLISHIRIVDKSFGEYMQTRTD